MHLKKGFSLIEVIVVLAIMGIMAGIVGPAALKYYNQSKVRKTETTLNTLKTAILDYYGSVGKYPNTLEDLIRKPADVPARKWGDAYISSNEVPVDGWNNEFIYRPTSKGKHPFELYSYGKNGPDADAGEMISVWDL